MTEVQRPITKESLKQYLPVDPVIIEAGAHKGRDTIRLHKNWPQAQIYAFEPVPELFALLQERTKGITQITAINKALSDTTGVAQLFVSSGDSDAASSLLEPASYRTERPGVKFERQSTTATITLDDFAAEYALQRVDFLWLDMQGYEMKMLQASAGVVSGVKALLTEVNLTQRYYGAPLYHTYRAWLEGQGFGLQAEDLFGKTWGNALFVRI